MADFVLNEWLWSDLEGETGTDRQNENLSVLTRLQASTDRIVVVLKSSFVRKFWNLYREASTPAQRLAVVQFETMLVDSNKCVQLEPDSLPDISDLKADCKQDDWYLIQAQRAQGAESLIVTTDKPLIEALRRHSIPCTDRNAWVRGYISTSVGIPGKFQETP